MQTLAQREILLKVGGHSGAPTWVKPPTLTQASYKGTREIIWRRATVVRYNCLFAGSTITCRRGVGGRLPPVVKRVKYIHE